MWMDLEKAEYLALCYIKAFVGPPTCFERGNNQHGGVGSVPSVGFNVQCCAETSSSMWWTGTQIIALLSIQFILHKMGPSTSVWIRCPVGLDVFNWIGVTAQRWIDAIFDVMRGRYTCDGTSRVLLFRLTSSGVYSVPGDSLRLLRLCLPCKSAEQLEWPVSLQTRHYLVSPPPADCCATVHLLLTFSDSVVLAAS